MAAARHPILLDCTIRDGSYAIDFKFTAEDTALIARELDRAGLRYIEVGHGLGLGATEAGKGAAASQDLDVIRRTREQVENASIGAFFIPGIGTDDDLRAAATAGLDFVRIGHNADQIDEVWPWVELAREAGLEAFVNLMKTYGITREDFARAADRAHAAGARGIYVVDSAGGMVPSEVAAYVEASLFVVPELAVGFHGHSNLHLAVANSLSAWEAGATFVDTSVFGIGRSSGNVPTEVMAAVFDRLGVQVGVDPLDVVDLAETWLRPLAEHLHPHDMTAVALGYGRFHSSFLPKALAAAHDNRVNPFRLIVECGRRDEMDLPDEILAEAVADLRGKAPPPETRMDVARFSDARFGERRIGNRPEAVAELIDGLDVVAAKRHLDVVLDLVPAPALEEEWIAAEFILDDDFMALGRVRFGSVDDLERALGAHAARLALALVDLAPLPHAEAAAVFARLSAELAVPLLAYSSHELELEYLGDVALAALGRLGADDVVLADPGLYARAAVDGLARRLAAVANVVSTSGDPPEDAGVVVVAGPPVSQGGDETGLVVGIEGARLPGDARARSGAVLELRRADAYRGCLPRWRRALVPRPRVEADA